MDELEELRLRVAKAKGWRLFYEPPREFPLDYPYYDFTNSERRIHFQIGRGVGEVDPLEHVRGMSDDDRPVFLHDLCRLIPNYPRDIAAALELYEEMEPHGICQLSNGDGDSVDFGFIPYKSKPIFISEPMGTNKATVITRAWLAWKEAA